MGAKAKGVGAMQIYMVVFDDSHSFWLERGFVYRKDAVAWRKRCNGVEPDGIEMLGPYMINTVEVEGIQEKEQEDGN